MAISWQLQDLCGNYEDHHGNYGVYVTQTGRQRKFQKVLQFVT